MPGVSPVSVAEIEAVPVTDDGVAATTVTVSSVGDVPHSKAVRVGEGPTFSTPFSVADDAVTLPAGSVVAETAVDH